MEGFLFLIISIPVILYLIVFVREFFLKYDEKADHKTKVKFDAKTDKQISYMYVIGAIAMFIMACVVQEPAFTIMAIVNILWVVVLLIGGGISL